MKRVVPAYANLFSSKSHRGYTVLSYADVLKKKDLSSPVSVQILGLAYSPGKSALIPKGTYSLRMAQLVSSQDCNQILCNFTRK